MVCIECQTFTCRERYLFQLGGEIKKSHTLRVADEDWIAVALIWDGASTHPKKCRLYSMTEETDIQGDELEFC